MSESNSPAPEGIYCLNCRYELRGLTSHRCPECGQSFDPSLASTYTRYPSPGKEVEDKVYQTMVALLREPKQGRRLSASIASLWRQQWRLKEENAELRSMLEALEQLLIEKGIVSDEEIRDRVHNLGLFEPAAGASTDQIARWLEQMVSNPDPAADEDNSTTFQAEQ